MSSLRRKRRSPEQIIAHLREADGMLSSGQTIGQVCQKLSISEQTYHRWRNHYGGMSRTTGSVASRRAKVDDDMWRILPGLVGRTGS